MRFVTYIILIAALAIINSSDLSLSYPLSDVYSNNPMMNLDVISEQDGQKMPQCPSVRKISSTKLLTCISHNKY